MESKFSMVPLGDKIVVKPTPKEEATKSGIVLPNMSKEKSMYGTVIAVGSGKLLESGIRIKPEVEVGDKILFSKYSGVEIKIDDEEYLIVKEVEILSVIK